VSIGKNTKLGDGVQISDSVLFDHVRVANFSSVKDAILGTGVNVGQWVKMEGSETSLVILADHVYVSSNMTLIASNSSVSRCPWEEIKESIIPSSKP
jgi:NDP-sugar pyrophosphorylase family protein